LRQHTLSKQAEDTGDDAGFERYTKKTPQAMFLEETEQVVSWAKLCARIEPHYPERGNGRRPKEPEAMLRIYFM
jgi:IS5 family transposase